MQTGYFNAAWQDIKNTPGWFGKLILLSLLSFVPIFGWLVVLGYLYGWARDIAWDVHGPMPKHIFGNEDRKLYSRGFFAMVIGFVFMLAPWVLEAVWGGVMGLGTAWSGGRHGGVFLFVGLSTMVFSLLIIAAAFFATLFSWVGSMRMSIYGRLAAGFQFGKIWAMIRHDFGGLLRILGMALLLAIAIGIVASVLIFVLVFIGLFVGFAMTGGNLNIQSAHPGAAVWAIVFATGGIVLVLAVLCGVLSAGMYVFVEMMIVRALGYWTRQFDVPARTIPCPSSWRARRATRPRSSLRTCRQRASRPCRAEKPSRCCAISGRRSAVLRRPFPFEVDSNRTREGKVGAMETAFLPVTREEMLERGWDRVDFVYVSGDAYVDHPSFGMAIITRLLEANGYKVGVIAQPDWNDPESVAVFGEPRLAFLVSAGNMDSMVNHYTVAKKRRRSDAYSPGGEAGRRPNHAAVVYGNLVRRTFKKTPVILGGIEASLRRLSHYDYWSDKLKRSILLDSGADLVSYGMGEHSIIEIADALNAGLAIEDLTFIDGTVYRAASLEHVYDAVTLPSFPAMQDDKLEYARSFAVQYENSDPFTGKRLVEPYSDHEFVVQNPPAAPLSQSEMDAVYRLPYARTYHPMYEAAGGIPAISEVKFSLTSNRGCFGECSFCALTFHQGRIVQTRSHDSLVDEARAIVEEPDFKGYIHDVGGPTANFRAPACAKQLKAGACPHKRCLYPEPCKQLRADHSDYLGLLRRLRKLPGVEKVFVRSGIRFDYVLADREHGDAFLNELCAHHVSGQLKVAPEHVSDAVLSVMGKPRNLVYQRFAQRYEQVNRQLGMKQFLVPYLMSSHPGSTLDEAVELAEYCRDLGYMPEQVQDFYPTPSTMSTAMYFTGVDPRTMQPVYVPKSPHEKALQRALIQYRDPKNRELVLEALRRAGRMDLVGFGPTCLLRPQGQGGGRDKGKGEAGAKPRAGAKPKTGAKPQAGAKPRPSSPTKPQGGRSGAGASDGRRGKSKAPRRH